ncbi:CLUMA_CG005058, isoform A [Clunio marinus]|uniref:CLUMA_CG005058, isoform A n=1 Tax=Clunio marinus TaxID=568069 RepID=A0A1J1HZ36_9DIPT|nr:CLUMA_CG005058, isoform A [Clunio marinus]
MKKKSESKCDFNRNPVLGLVRLLASLIHLFRRRKVHDHVRNMKDIKRESNAYTRHRHVIFKIRFIAALQN